MQLHAFSPAEQQASPHTEFGQSAGQLHRVSSASQVPSPQPPPKHPTVKLHVVPAGQGQSWLQVAQFSPASQVPLGQLPHSPNRHTWPPGQAQSMQSQYSKGGPAQNPSPQTQVQSSPQVEQFSADSQMPLPHSKQVPSRPHCSGAVQPQSGAQDQQSSPAAESHTPSPHPSHRPLGRHGIGGVQPQSESQELQFSPSCVWQMPSPHPTHCRRVMLHCVPGGQGQSSGHESQVSLPAQVPSPQLALAQSAGHVVPFSPSEQQPSPQFDVVQSVLQRHGFSVGPQQKSPQVSVQSPPNITWQLQPVSPGSQTPSPQPLHGGPQA